MVWLKSNISLILSFLVGVFITSTLFLLINKRDLEKEIIEVEKPVIKTQTIIKTDTVTITKTIPHPEYITETIIRTDTIKSDSIIPIVQRQYCTLIDTDTIKGSINASVSGFEAVLDTLTYNLNIYPKTITNSVEMQITKYKTKHWNFTVGIGAGYGLFNKQPDIFVGAVWGYTF